MTVSDDPEHILRTLGIARTKDLNGSWRIDPEPIVPAAEQVENTSLCSAALGRDAPTIPETPGQNQIVTETGELQPLMPRNSSWDFQMWDIPGISWLGWAKGERAFSEKTVGEA